VSGLVSFALEHGIRTYTGVAEMGWLQQILAFGWDCRPLGAPLPLGGRLTGALAICISSETPALLDRNGIWTAEALELAPLAAAA
jgi:acyl-homoserine lactone synthase